MTSAELKQRLNQIRRRTQQLVAVGGVAQFVLASTLAVVGLFALDWWIHMPAFLRAGASLAALWLAAVWITRRVVQPMRREIPLQEIALRVDRAHPSLGDRLTTAVEQFDASGESNNILWRRVVDQALLAADSVPWNRLVEARRIRRTVALACLLALLFGAGTRLWPGPMSIGLRRFAWPLGATQWPRSVEIAPLSRDLVVAAGEPIEVRARVVRGGSENLRVWVVWRDVDQIPRRELMNSAEPGVYWQSNASVRVDLAYWFEAGDDSTADHPGQVHVVQRPSVAKATLTLTPPAYAAVLGETTQQLQEGQAVALAGSRARIELDITKPVGRDTQGRAQAVLRDTDGKEHALSAVDEALRRWRADLEIEHALTLRLALTDAEGLGLRTTPQYKVDVQPDAPPSVAITRPSHMLEVAPAAEVEVAVTAQDDIDLVRVALRARIADGRELPERVLWEGSARQERRKSAADTGDASSAHTLTFGEPARKDVTASWSLAEYQLGPGMVVEYWAEAADGYEMNGKQHAPAKSAVMRLRVLSSAEFAERMHDESLALMQRLRQVAADQDAVRRDTVSASARQTSSQPSITESLLRRQRTLNSAVLEIADLFKALSERMQRNQFEDRAAQHEADATASELRNVQQGAMSQAAGSLSQAGGQEREHLRAAAEFQATAAAALHRMLSGLEKAVDFDGVVRKTRDLLDRQEELTRASTATTQELAGIEQKSLSNAQRGRLSDISNRQDGLSRELADMLARFDKLARDLSRQDRASADALARAREAVEHESVAQHMREATDAIRQNHGNRAIEAQGAAERGLRSMLSALSERSDRKLAELSKQLADLAQRLERLIRAQEDLIARTQSTGKQADAATAVPGLATRQTTLKRTTAQLAEQIRTSVRGKASKEGAEPAMLVDQAASRMDEAGAKLSAADATDAIGKQVAAVDLLHRANEALAAAQEAADKEIAARALDALKQSLAEIRTAELVILEKTESIRERQGKEKRVSRSDGINLNKLATEQSDLAGRLDAARKKMLNSVVYDFVCARAHEKMQEASELLKEHKPVEAVNAERAAADELAQLIEALNEPAAKQNRFAEEDSNSGGGGASGAQQERPIPPLAELKLLRALQANLNAAVKKFDAKVPPPEAPSEAELRQAEALGKQQQKIHDLATKLMGK